MELPSHIFRAYDIRGVFGRDLTPDVMARIGGAISNYLKTTYAVGSDFRFSSPILKGSLISGLLGAGSDVVDIGSGPIGMAMFSTKHLGYGMAYITASHLPPEWNGVKLSGPRARLMYGNDIYSIRDIFLGKIEWSGIETYGRLSRRDVLPEYKEFVSKTTRSKGGLKILVDCGNGATSIIVPQLLRDLGHSVFTVNCEVDPRFPGRGSEPTPEAVKRVSDLVVSGGFDFGVAFDGDGDRTLFIDDRGRPLSSEQAAIIMLEGNGMGNIVANVECSSILEDFVRDKGYVVKRVPVGRTYMVLEMERGDYVLGVESSGHYVTYRNANMDDGIMTFLYFVEAVEKLGTRVSEKVLPMPYRKKLKLEVGDEKKFEIVSRLKQDFARKYSRVDTIDGVRVDLEHGWFLIRPSNTEPIIRVTVEGRTREDVEEIEKIVLESIKQYT